jgi:hypothetical protein
MCPLLSLHHQHMRLASASAAHTCNNSKPVGGIHMLMFQHLITTNRAVCGQGSQSSCRLGCSLPHVNETKQLQHRHMQQTLQQQACMASAAWRTFRAAGAAAALLLPAVRPALGLATAARAGRLAAAAFFGLAFFLLEP